MRLGGWRNVCRRRLSLPQTHRGLCRPPFCLPALGHLEEAVHIRATALRAAAGNQQLAAERKQVIELGGGNADGAVSRGVGRTVVGGSDGEDRKSTRLNSSH